MFKKAKNQYYYAGASFTVGMIASSEAFAQNTFNTIGKNIVTSIEELPGLLTALAYMFGIILAVLGVMKIKDHVENPSNTPLKDGAIRLAAGGALFALPIITDAMLNTIGDDQAVTPGKLNKVQFNVN